MISVVIPTMWKPPHLNKMLPILDRHSLIGEIILIDNDRTKTNHNLLKKISKLRYYSFSQENIFVNPAWNCGAQVSKYDKLFILNDDCLVNLISLDKIYDMIIPENGILGFSEESYCNYELDAFDLLCSAGYGSNLIIKEINPGEYKKTTGMPHFYYGSAMFIHKKNFVKIPENLKIYYGDLFIYLMNLQKNLFNYMISNGLVMSKPSYTVSDFSTKILKAESELVRNEFKVWGIDSVSYKIKKEN